MLTKWNQMLVLVRIQDLRVLVAEPLDTATQLNGMNQHWRLFQTMHL